MKTQKNWEIPQCNNCNSRAYKILFTNLTYWEYSGKFQIVQCRTCLLVMTSPRPILSEIGKYYVQENYFGTEQGEGETVSPERMFGPMYRIIDAQKKKGRMLDIGAGVGSFLSYYQKKGWNVEGVELMQEAVNHAKRQYGIALKKGDFFDFRFQNKKYDVVTLNGALEHLYYPLQTLKRIEMILKDDGLLAFSVPNYESIGRKLFGRYWFAWQPPRHLYHYSPDVIKDMLKKAGFKKITIEYNYWLQNYYILFQSFRYALSPTFQQKPEGGLAIALQDREAKFSPKKFIGKYLAQGVAYFLAFLEPLIKKGEVMIIYAEKS